jgi:DNA repair protein RadC
MSALLTRARSFARRFIRSAFAFMLVHNHPSGVPNPSNADVRLTKRIASGARILQIKFLDHVIVGYSTVCGAGYFSFREAGLL